MGAEWAVEVGGRDCQGWGGWHGRKRWVRGRTAELQAGPGKDRTGLWALDLPKPQLNKPG